MEDITKLNLHQTRDALNKKQFSCKELIASHVKEMESSRPLNLFITETMDHAIKSAEISFPILAISIAGAFPSNIICCSFATSSMNDLSSIVNFLVCTK